MSYEERKQASLGKDKVMYCPTCMQENEVYSGAGHKPNEVNLHCVECTHFVARLIRKSPNHNWELDMSVYNTKEKEGLPK